MATHKNKHRQIPQQNQKPAPSTEGAAGNSPTSGPVTAADITTPGTAIEAISKVHSQALETATEGDIEAATKAAPAGTDGLDIVKAARDLWEANELCRARAERMSRLEEGERALKESQDLLAQEQAQLAVDRKALEERESSLKVKEEEVREREDGLRVRELNAEAGFAAERRVSLQLLDQEAAAVREELSRARGLISAERADWDARWRQEDQRVRAELEQLRREQAEQHAASVGELDEQRRQFETEASQTRAALKKQQAQLDVREDLLREDREAFDLRVKQRAGAALEEAEAKYRDLEARLAAARKERDSLYERLREREEAERALGNRPLDQVKRELDALIKENKSLADRLAKRPSEDMVARLEMLERSQEEWEADRARLSQELMASRASVARSAIAVTELESLRDQKAALETGRDLLQAALEELRKDVDERIRRSDGVSPFPSCSQMDGDDALQGRVPMFDEIPDLAAFCGDLQNRVAFDPTSGKELYYSLSDIRCFLAGMAMSRLHLLQGISGTGKTSLPLAFARALGAGAALIEVQAGWRDRQDLIGHFNAFERRFYESEFLQALYKAQCPRYADGVFIVVLDEMNLSHPEQYFADLLSALEQDPQYQKLDLMTAAVEPAPALLQNGRTLPLPQNVWFVGTANHDETTKDFADKTYDRAHVMELPRHRESFKPKKTRARAPVSLATLKGAFEAAQNAYQQQAAAAYRFVDAQFAEILGRRFRVGWGNRLERQMLNFVPVVLAAGGTMTEAVDHILATKLLRKIRDRHDTRPEDLEALRLAVEEAWPRLGSQGEPVKSTSIVRAELRRLGADEAE
ncbi:MAG TPA: AAA family ATPase [Thiobacillaceae bacterium]|nr:AAA family ATPase [Thiobacillaceae bacterium]HNU64959.1 AAA family ATPase [Thiobacillaceae bacterium]